MMKYVVLLLIVVAITLMAYRMGTKNQTSPGGTPVVTAESTVRDVLALDEGLEAVLTTHGMHCSGCPSAVSETLEQACAVHNLNPDEILHAVNGYLANKENTDGTESV